jgi:DNA-binding MarR family transcriptional regulator
MSSRLRLAGFFPYRCTRLAERISVALSRTYVERFAIGVAEWRILATLGEYGRMQARDIGLHTNMDKVRVSRAVRQLRDKGHLVSEVVPSDNRATLLGLSATGRRLYRRIAPEALAWESSLLAPLSAEERQTMARIIDKLEQRLTELADA